MLFRKLDSLNLTDFIFSTLDLIPGVVVKYIERNGLYRTVDGKGGRVRDHEDAEWKTGGGPSSSRGPSRANSRPSSIHDDKMQIAGSPLAIHRS